MCLFDFIKGPGRCAYITGTQDSEGNLTAAELFKYFTKRKSVIQNSKIGFHILLGRKDIERSDQ